MTHETRTRTVAILSANPALAALLGREIEQGGSYRAPVFSSMPALSTFLRIAPVDLLVLSLDIPWSELIETVRALKAAPRNANPLLQVIVLTHAAPFATAASEDLAAVLTKPIRPGQLVEAVEAALLPAAPRRPKIVRDMQVRPRHRLEGVPVVHGSNVIPLFGRSGTRPDLT